MGLFDRFSRAMGTASSPSPSPDSQAGVGAQSRTVGDDPDTTTPPRMMLWSWGDNEDGQLGDGAAASRVKAGVAVEIPGEIVAVEAGTHSAFALCADGTVWSWGANSQGELGHGTQTSRSGPLKVVGLSGVVALASWDATYALKSDGTVWAWGANNAFQLGDGTESFRSTPSRVDGLSNVVAIAASDASGFALKADGTVWAWGSNEHGEIGGAPVEAATAIPVQVQRFDESERGGAALERGHGLLGRPLTGIKAIASGFRSAYALASDGSVWSWGDNSFGQLGDGEISTSLELRMAQLIRHNAADRVRGLTGVTAISSKGLTAYALRKDGTVWSWGANHHGQLGCGFILPERNGLLDYSAEPVPVRGLTKVTSISAMGDSVFAVHHAAGQVSSWGENEYGELGDGTQEDRSRPTNVLGLRGVTAIAAGIDFAIAIAPEGARASDSSGEETDPEKQFQLALAAGFDGQHERYPVLLNRAAEAGHIGAMKQLLDEFLGAGNASAAEPWAIKLAVTGDAELMRVLGTILESRDDFPGAVHWYSRSVEVGSTSAMLNLGDVCQKMKDVDQAVGWLWKAAHAGEVAAYNNLALVYESRGDMNRAVSSYLTAARMGDSSAMYNLGVHYTQQGDMDEASTWFTQAGDAGDADGWLRVSWVHMKQGDSREAQRWLLKAARAGQPEARQRLGIPQL